MKVTALLGLSKWLVGTTSSTCHSNVWNTAVKMLHSWRVLVHSGDDLKRVMCEDISAPQTAKMLVVRIVAGVKTSSNTNKSKS